MARRREMMQKAKDPPSLRANIMEALPHISKHHGSSPSYYCAGPTRPMRKGESHNQLQKKLVRRKIIHIYMCAHIYIYIYTYIHTHTYIHDFAPHSLLYPPPSLNLTPLSIFFQ